MTAYTRWLPEQRITVWAYSSRAFDVKIRDRAVRHFRNGRPYPERLPR
jgi:hypothetical protein